MDDLDLGPTATTARRAFPGGALSLQATTVAGHPDAVEVLATFKARANRSTTKAPPVAATLGLRLSLGAWSRAATLVLPGACYQGNRFESRHTAYPPLLTEAADIGPNVPTIVSDIPRLNLRDGPSGIELAASDLATPAAAIHFPARMLGLIVLVDPWVPAGRTGLALTENDDRTAATLGVTAPFSSEQARGPGGGASGRRPRGATLRDGEQTTLRARIFVFDCPDVPALLARLFEVRKQLTGQERGGHELPFSAAFAAHEDRINRRWVEAQGFYAAGARGSAYTTWQTGWGGSLAAALPLLAAGTARSRARARRSTTFAIGEGQALSGFFHAVSDGKAWFEDGFTAPLPNRAPPAPVYKQAQRWHLVRRSADTLWTLVRQLALYERRPQLADGPKTTAQLAEGARRTADAFVRLWERFHQLGQFVDIETGDLRVGGSASAGLAPAGLALASVQLKHEPYLRVARAAGEHYHERFVRAGFTCGGPGDALQCPDSQSAAALLESFVTLFEVTREPVWLERARAAAHLFASWVISYEPPEEPGAPKRELRATGGVLWDAQNGGGSPWILSSSGSALLRLYRATGEVALLELLRDGVHNLPQYLRCAPKAEPGTEPIAPSVWSTGASRTDTRRWLESPGPVVPAEGAFDAIALQAYTEVPGVYARTDTGFVYAFDHVEARVKEKLAGRIVVTLTNPTNTEATVRMLAETGADAGEPLPPGAVLETPTAVVPAGGSVDVMLPAGLARR